ncbi:hypothetical protein [Embleya scabrispora]|uniref:hypothetical protein n=1 Tax=Embleya scabrispora TaxID=159449 RepID=UPI001319F448|nr:hypothetical protein [Embleya scabrispora]MYS80336.1 hypothetical protein [Streptomyces sp. SID5474]
MADKRAPSMRQARDATARVVSAREIDDAVEQFVRPLRCAYCDHEVHATRSYPSTSSKGTVFTVAAHFRLAHHKGAGPAAHLPGCALRTDEVIESIARGAPGLAEVWDEILTLRLVVPATTDTGHESQPPVGAPVRTPPAERVAHRVHTVGPLLPPVVTTAVRIARFLALHDHDRDTVARFTVRVPDPFGTRIVPWTDVCHDAANPADMARLHRSLDDSTARRHPKAVLGIVEDAGVKAGKAWCRLAARTPTGATGSTRANAAVYLRSRDPRLLEPLIPGIHVLGLGAPDVPWAMWRPERGAAQIRLWPSVHWQVAYWSVDEFGLPTEPSCPDPLPPPRAAPPRPRSAPDAGARARRTPPRQEPPSTPAGDDSAAAHASTSGPHVEPAPSGASAPPTPPRPSTPPPRPDSPPPRSAPAAPTVPEVPQRPTRRGVLAWFRRR